MKDGPERAVKTKDIEWVVLAASADPREDSLWTMDLCL